MITLYKVNSSGSFENAQHISEQNVLTDNCPICLDIFANDNEYSCVVINVGDCNHQFHHLCIGKWLKREVQVPSCPMCRANLVGLKDELADFTPEEPLLVVPERITPELDGGVQDNNGEGGEPIGANDIDNDAGAAYHPDILDLHAGPIQDQIVDNDIGQGEPIQRVNKSKALKIAKQVKVYVVKAGCKAGRTLVLFISSAHKSPVSVPLPLYVGH